MTIDVDALLRATDIVAVARQYTSLKPIGREHVGFCPFHKEGRRGNFHVNPEKRRAFCMSCHWNGDAIALVCEGDGVSFKEACDRLGAGEFKPAKQGEGGQADVRPAERLTQKPPADARAPDFVTRNLGKPARVWEYRDADGSLLFYVARYPDPDFPGGKITPQWTWGSKDGGKSWRWGMGHYREPRPLYGLDRLAARPKAPVLVVEGEKDADAAQEHLPAFVVVTWPGGTNGVDKVDWSPLAGRDVVIWPDQDLQAYKDDHPAAGMVKPTAEQPGTMAAMKIAAKLHGQAKQVKVVDVTPADDEPPKASGWSVSDAVLDGMETPDLLEWAKPRARIYTGGTTPEESAAPAVDDPPPIAPAETPAAETAAPPPPADPMDDLDEFTRRWPFKVLGYNRGIFYYLPRGAVQIKELSARAHQKNELLELGPLQWWEGSFPGKQGADWTAAADLLMRASHKRGIFMGAEAVRGRGAWIDDGRAVFHLGDFLLVDGQPVILADFKTKNVYEAGRALDLPEADAASNKEAFEFFEICRGLRWESGLSAYLFAGWCVIASVCGILKWRPHAWIIGPAGSGKSTVLGIVYALLGSIASKVEAGTTAAGITGTLTTDALPILFDEAESDDEQSRSRMQAILELARVSASGGVIIKGTRTGGTRRIIMRSAMMFSSINPMLNGYADESRFAQLTLAKNEPKDDEERAKNADAYEDLVARIVKTLTPTFSAGLLMRTLDNLVTLRANVDTFTTAASLHLGSRRLGDQVGPLLAGAYLLHSVAAISQEKALEWMRQRNFTEHTAQAGERDHESMLSKLLQFRVRWNAGNLGQTEKTVGELIRMAYEDSDKTFGENAIQALARYGFKVDHDNKGLWISTTHHAMKKEILGGARSSAALRAGLKSIDGARAWKNNVRFAESSTPAMWLPLASVLGE